MKNYKVFFGLFVAFYITGCMPVMPTASVFVKDSSDAGLLIQNVTVLDVKTLSKLPNRDVLIRAGQVSAISLSGKIVSTSDMQIIDGTGATLLPGLIDMHGHITTTTGPSWEFSLPDAQGNLLSYLYAGVTTIFDPSDSSDEAYERRQKVADGELLGPRIYTTGRIITHPEGHPRSLIATLAPWWIRWYLKPKVGAGVTTPEEAIKEVNVRADADADAIKIVIDQIPLDAPLLTDQISKAIVEQARKRGIRAVAHIGTTADAIAAAEAGVALWVHGVYKERIPDDKIAQLVSYKIPMVSTSEVFDRYGRAMVGPIEPSKLELEIVPTETLDAFYPVPEDFDPGPLTSWIELMQKTSGIRRDNVSRLHAAGMTILAGSDVQSGVFPGASLHRELQTLVAAGLTPSEAIRAATFFPARYLAKTETPEFGLVEVGKRADLLLVNGDPTQDISALADIREVLLGGRLLQRQAVRNP
ncbi:MAG: imidazolonepropionase-like amidohydrolase [Parvicella sp.]